MNRFSSLPRILKKETKFVFLGLDFAGKTAMVFRMKTGKFEENLLPTTSIEEDFIKVSESLKFHTIDLSGHESLRNQWKESIIEADGIIFVIDAADTNRFIEAKVEFHNRIMPLLVGKPCVIACNKFDLIWEKQSNRKREDLIEEIEPLIQSEIDIPKSSEVKVFVTSQKTGLGNSDVISFLRERLILKQS